MLSASDGPFILGVPVSANSSNVFTTVTNGLYIGATGNVNVQFGVPQQNNANLGGTYNYSNTSYYANCMFVGVPAGTILRIRVNKIYDTSTTANSIVALF